MDSYNINGYGYDLAHIINLTPKQQKVLDTITKETTKDDLDLESIYQDLVLDLENNYKNTNCLMAFPCNTDDFDDFIYLPDIPAVQTSQTNHKIYTPEEGQKQLFDFTTKLLHAAGKAFNINQNKVDNLLKVIKPQIKEFAQYHTFQDYC